MDKITPQDQRVAHKYATLNGHKYYYLLGVPSNGQFKGTIFLVHGWPDLSFGWRYQIPLLLNQGLRVVAPDIMGYGGTDAPKVPPNSLHLYGYKRAADDIAALAKELNAPKIILGGHDWGGMIVYRTAQWYPELVTHLFSVCTPFAPPSSEFISTADLVAGPLPQFGYQLQLAGPDVEAGIQSEDQIRNFLKGMFGGRGEGGRIMFKPETGVQFDVLPTVGMTSLLNEEELEYYTKQYTRNGMHGPLNWYRNREANHKDELALKTKGISQPVLFIAGAQDSVLKPEMSRGMETLVPKLSRREVKASHWALWQAPVEVNEFIKEWLDGVVFGGKSSL